MDLFSHIFWTWAVFKVLTEKLKKPLNLKLTIFWGVFPDLFAFGIPILLLILELLTGKISVSDLPGVEKIEPPQQNFNSIIQLVSTLYSISHSLVIFFAALIVIMILTTVFSRMRKMSPQTLGNIIPWEFSGWMFHILIDIPTHSTQFYSTPFLWPISDFKISGISWGTPWFLALNYLVMITLYLAYFRKKKNNI